MVARKTQIFISLLASVFLFSSTTFGGEKNDPEFKKPKRFLSGCYMEGYYFKHRVLHLKPKAAGPAASIYFMHNLSMNKPVTLYQMKTGGEGYIMNLNNTIRPNQWGVFASDQTTDRFICTIPNSKYTYGEIVDCKKYVDVCEFTNAVFGTNMRGNYWIINSSHKSGAKWGTIRKGALLRK